MYGKFFKDGEVNGCDTSELQLLLKHRRKHHEVQSLTYASHWRRENKSEETNPQNHYNMDVYYEIKVKCPHSFSSILHLAYFLLYSSLFCSFIYCLYLLLLILSFKSKCGFFSAKFL